MELHLSHDNLTFLKKQKAHFACGTYTPKTKRILNGVIRFAGYYLEQVRDERNSVEWLKRQPMSDKSYVLGTTAKKTLASVVTILGLEMKSGDMVCLANHLVKFAAEKLAKEELRKYLKDYLNEKDFSGNPKQLCFDLPEDIYRQVKEYAVGQKQKVEDYLARLLNDGFSDELIEPARALLHEAQKEVEKKHRQVIAAPTFVVVKLNEQAKLTLTQAADPLEQQIVSYLVYKTTKQGPGGSRAA